MSTDGDILTNVTLRGLPADEALVSAALMEPGR